MTANQRFTFLVFVLFCITCAGTTFALVSLDVGIDKTAVHRPRTERLSVSSTSIPKAVRRDLAVKKPARLSFMRRSIGPLELLSEDIYGAADPDSWSILVKEEVPPPVRSKRSVFKNPARNKAKVRYSLRQRLAEISPAATARVAAKFKSAGVSWPPAEIALLAIKDEKALELYSRPENGEWKFVHRYKVLAASGTNGPKLKRGDKQVPEGIYSITYLNPNSAFHVSLRVNYPNTFDRKMAKNDGRKDLGGDIMIHGENASAGCLAVGNISAEELFVLAAEVGKPNIKVVIAPTDFRRNAMTPRPKGPKWIPALYTELENAMSEFKAPPPPSLLTLLGF